MSAGGEEGMTGITGERKSYADISMTGDAGGERCVNADSSPSRSGNQDTPAMSVARSRALREEPMVGDDSGVRTAS